MLWVGLWVEIMLTSAKSVQAVTSVGYHRAGPGLYLQVSSTGTKSWIFRFKSPITQKQREMGLGSLSILSLAEAREKALECKRQVQEAQDPIEERKKRLVAQRLEQARELTFEALAGQCIRAKSPEWKNAKHAKQWQATLATYAYPIIGSVPVNDINTDLVLKVLEPIWTTKPETASRLRQRVETILDFGKARGLINGDNPARLKGHLDALLPKVSKVKRVKHFPALPFQELPQFIKLLETKHSISALGLCYLILTAARTGEVLGATWSEIDLQARTWVLPPERMKAQKEHRVPLSEPAMRILEQLPSNRQSNEPVFKNLNNGKGLSNGAFLKLLKSMDYGHVTPHGFRSSFRDWAAEKAISYPADTVELALAHTIKSRVEAAYRRGDQLERRRDLMRDWGAYVSGR